MYPKKIAFFLACAAFFSCQSSYAMPESDEKDGEYSYYYSDDENFDLVEVYKLTDEDKQLLKETYPNLSAEERESRYSYASTQMKIQSVPLDNDDEALTDEIDRLFQQHFDSHEAWKQQITSDLESTEKHLSPHNNPLNQSTTEKPTTTHESSEDDDTSGDSQNPQKAVPDSTEMEDASFCGNPSSRKYSDDEKTETKRQSAEPQIVGRSRLNSSLHGLTPYKQEKESHTKRNLALGAGVTLVIAGGVSAYVWSNEIAEWWNRLIKKKKKKQNKPNCDLQENEPQA